jgi:hypothetical protein
MDGPTSLRLGGGSARDRVGEFSGGLTELFSPCGVKAAMRELKALGAGWGLEWEWFRTSLTCIASPIDGDVSRDIGQW